MLTEGGLPVDDTKRSEGFGSAAKYDGDFGLSAHSWRPHHRIRVGERECWRGT
jgi:hypothetical protein